MFAEFGAGDVSITGEMATYRGVGDSDKGVFRRLCPCCGSPIVSESAAAPGLYLLKVGTLDDTGGEHPGADG